MTEEIKQHDGFVNKFFKQQHRYAEIPELNNCPFCNCRPRFAHGAAKTVAPFHYISCDSCGTHMAVGLDFPESKDSETEKKLLIQKWNIRHTE